MQQGPSHVVLRVVDTSDTSGDQTDVCQPRRKMGFKRNYKVSNVGGVSEVGRFLVTRPDVTVKPIRFHYCACRRDVSVFTHVRHEILRLWQGSKHFHHDQRLRLETPSWDVFVYESNRMSHAEM